MTMISVVGARGGSGVSLLATNLGVALAAMDTCLLLDLNPLLGYDDLLLDLKVERSWIDLLPVAGELTDHHLNLAAGSHASGLRFLGAPHSSSIKMKRTDVTRLLKELEKRFTWLLLDLPVMDVGMTSVAFPLTDILLLVSTMDPQSLRSAKRLTETLPASLLHKAGMVFNQVTPGHPADPEAAASPLGLPLLAVLPVEYDAVGRQVNFGQPCVANPQSKYGRAVTHLAERMAHMGSDRQTELSSKEATPAVEVLEKKDDA
jgi:Flp pilus assembly CpaE family ATPase